MKISKTNRFLCWILIYAFTLMQVSPAWANAAVGGSSGGSPGGGSNQGTNTGGSGGSTTDPIDTKSGNCYFTETDLAFNTPGIPLVFSRKYNSNETYDSPVGGGWSHSMDWRLHQAREIITKIVPPVTNQNFKITLWEGTQLLCDGQIGTEQSSVDTNGVTNVWVEVTQTNLVTVIPEFLYGAPVKDPTEAEVSQPGNNYSIDLDQPYIHGSIGATNPLPILGLEDMATNALPMDGITYETNQWLEVYTGDGASSRYWDNNTNGVYWATDKNWSITSSTNDLWTLHLPGGEERIFNADGRMIRHQDGWGRGITFAYNTGGELTSAEHDSGLTLQFTYTDGHVTGVSAGTGASLTYGYTTNGLLDTVTQQYGSEQRIRRFEYTDGIMTKRISPEGHEYNYGYVQDAASNLTAKANSLSVEEAEWNAHQLTYRSDTLTDVMYTTRGLQQWHRYAYSSKSGKLDNHFGPGTNTVDAETRGIRYAYNTAKDETEYTRFDNSTGAFSSSFTDYDGRHNPTASAVAYNTTNRTPVSSMAWNSTFMMPSSIQNAEGEKTTMTYTNGSLAKSSAFYTESNSWNTIYGYTASGLLAAVTNANGNATQYTYDSRGYPETVIPAVGPSVATAYDTYGNVQTLEILPEGETNGTGRITQYSANPLGWVTQVTFPDGLSVSNQYNKLGDLTNTVDRAGRVTEFTYTPESYLASRTQYLEQNGSNVPVRISYDYDQQFNTLSITEPRGRCVESYQLDIQDRVTSVTNIEGQSMTFGYSVGSMVTNVTRFDQSRLDTSYDSAGRQSAIAYYSSSNELLSTISRTYYADSQLKTISDGTSSVSNSYDRLNRLTASLIRVDSSNSWAVSYSHDPVGNLTNSVVSLNNSSINNLTTSYSYDTAERLTWISQSGSGFQPLAFSLNYNPTNGQLFSVVNTNSGVGVQYGYDLMDRRQQINWTDAETNTLRGLDYGFDALGMITNITTEAGKKKVYVYDTINRLVDEKHYNLSDALTYSAAYEYDLAGNRTRTVINGVTNDYTLGTGNRLASVDATPSSRSLSFGYDTAGNTVAITNIEAGVTNVQSLAWDERYRLTSVDEASSLVSYTYDVLGRRVSRAENGTTNYFVYNGNQVATDLDENGNIIRSYTWGPGIDNLLSLTVWSGGSGSTPTTTYYPLKDHQNSVLALADESGNITESYEYDAWGKVLSIKDGSGNVLSQSAIGNRYMWQGREYDAATGLYYFRARWYSPETGRWLSKDPIGISGGLNMYAFCGNNPVNFIDPFGLCVKPDDKFSIFKPKDEPYVTGLKDSKLPFLNDQSLLMKAFANLPFIHEISQRHDAIMDNAPDKLGFTVMNVPAMVTAVAETMAAGAEAAADSLR